MYSGQCQTSERAGTKRPVSSDQTFPLKTVMKEPRAFEITFSNATLHNRNDTLISFYELISFDNSYKQYCDHIRRAKTIGSIDVFPFPLQS